MINIYRFWYYYFVRNLNGSVLINNILFIFYFCYYNVIIDFIKLDNVCSSWLME